ncbi:MAG: hypothetical protein AB7T49_18400 [Oligoflexales bacterium]
MPYRSLIFLNVIVFSFISGMSFSEELTIVMGGSPIWEISQEGRSQFEAFLESERQSLVNEIPNLKFPATFDPEKGTGGAITTYLLPTSPRYVNRKVSCQFLQKVFSKLYQPQLLKLARLTRNGEICTSGDLPAEQRNAFNLSLAHFFWNEPWIPTKGKNVNLLTFLNTNLQLDTLPKVRFAIYQDHEFEGLPYGFSSADLAFIEAHSLFKTVVQRGTEFDPNNSVSAPDLGEAAKGLDPFELAGFLITEPTIFFTNDWEPQGLVEILAHEYGHLYHIFHQSRFSELPDGSIKTTTDGVYNEAAAEAFAWNGLLALYPQFPEVKVLHIMKLKIFSQFRKNDNHVLGASAFGSDFHRQEKINAQEFDAFVNAVDLKTWMQQMPKPPLNKVGTKEEESLRLEWQD